jgi:hypothetical protein
MKKIVKRPMKLNAETVRNLRSTDLGGVRGGLICSEPSCHICDTMAPDCLTTSNTTF